MPNTNRVARDGDEYQGQLRLPAPLAQRVKSKAARERRSMNSQIIIELERALPAETKAATEAGTSVAAE